MISGYLCANCISSLLSVNRHEFGANGKEAFSPRLRNTRSEEVPGSADGGLGWRSAAGRLSHEEAW